MKNEQLNQLLYEALETEMGGVQVYKTAIRCAVNEDLKEEWEEYLEQTQKHEQIVRELLGKFKLDPDIDTPGRKIVRHIGQSLVKAMEMALESGKPEAAQIVATECVVEAETKDHLNWELIAQVAEKTKGEDGKTLKEAYEQVEEEEDEHLYHNTGWARELWIESLGLPAVIPTDLLAEKPVTGGKNARKHILHYRCHCSRFIYSRIFGVALVSIPSKAPKSDPP